MHSSKEREELLMHPVTSLIPLLRIYMKGFLSGGGHDLGENSKVQRYKVTGILVHAGEEGGAS